MDRLVSADAGIPPGSVRGLPRGYTIDASPPRLPMTVLALSGSLRAGSSALARAIGALAPSGVTLDVYSDLGDVPPYTPDVDTEALWVTEVWDRRESHATSLALPSVREAIARARPLIARFGPARAETEPCGGLRPPGVGVPPAP